MNPPIPSLPQLTPAAIEGLRGLLSAIEVMLAAAPPPPAAVRRTIQEIGNEFLVSKACSGRSPSYLKTARAQLKMLFRGRMLREAHTIRAEEIEKWIAEEQWSAYFRRSVLCNASTFFLFARKRGYLSDNPTEAIEAPILEDKPPGIQTPAEVMKVLQTAQRFDPDVMRFLAIQYFAGLRVSEVASLTESEIGPRYIVVQAHKAKTRRRRLVTVTPTLRAWLDVGGQLPLKDPHTRLWKLRKAVGLTFPRNAARHSFCSYHLAQFGNAAKTALEAGHSEVMLFAHYREIVTPESAAEYWAIRPLAQSEGPGIIVLPKQAAA